MLGFLSTKENQAFEEIFGAGKGITIDDTNNDTLLDNEYKPKAELIILPNPQLLSDPS